jgi:hypothetical protein
MNPLTPEELEQRLHRALRDVPLHRAPDTLEDRVLAVLAARAARPWWQRSYSHWPVAARSVFLVGSATVAALVIIASVAGLQQAGSLIETPVAGVRDQVAQARAAGSVLADLGRGWLPEIPSLWLYGVLGAAAAAYATLLGLGAAAYRLLVRRA